MNKDMKVSRLQIRGLIVSTIIGVGVLSLPHDLAMSMENKGWIAIIISGLLTLPFIYIINKLFEQNPGKDFFQIGKETFGVVIFTICKIILLAYFIVLLSLITRIFGEQIKAFLLPTTPVEIIIITFLIACSYITSYEIDVIARAGYFTYPIILIFTTLILLISLPNSDFSNLLPISDLDLSKIPEGVKIGYFSFAGFEMIIFSLPYVEDRKKVFQSCTYGIFIVMAIYIVTFINTVSQFSITQLQRQTYPVIQLAKKIDLPGYFLENLDGLVMAFWVIIIFATIIPFLYGAGKILTKIFNTKKHKYFIWGLIPVIYYVALYPDNFISIDKDLGFYFNILSVISVIIIPSLLLAVDTIKKRVIN